MICQNCKRDLVFVPLNGTMGFYVHKVGGIRCDNPKDYHYEMGFTKDNVARLMNKEKNIIEHLNQIDKLK